MRLSISGFVFSKSTTTWRLSIVDPSLRAINRLLRKVRPQPLRVIYSCMLFPFCNNCLIYNIIINLSIFKFGLYFFGELLTCMFVYLSENFFYYSRFFTIFTPQSAFKIHFLLSVILSKSSDRCRTTAF